MSDYEFPYHPERPPERRVERRAPDPDRRSRPQRGERRSRLLALIVLIAVVLVFVFVGLAIGSDAEGGNDRDTVPFKVLPITPKNQTGATDGDTSTTSEPAEDEPAGTDPAEDESAGDESGLTATVATWTQTAETVGDVDGDGMPTSSPTGTTGVAAPGAVAPDGAALSGALTLSAAGLNGYATAATASADRSAAAAAGGDTAAIQDVATIQATAADVPILMYHYVADVPPPAGPYASALTVRTSDFEEQMRYLAENGYHTITLDDLYLARQGLKALPTKAVALTFDDGGLDNYRVAYPILTEYGLTATFFVVTGKVGAAGHMDWDDLREMAGQGMAVESHTVSHPTDLRTLDQSRLEKELTESRTAIAQNLGEVPAVLSYPSGRYDERVVAAAKAAGYLIAVSTNVGTDEGPDADYQICRARVTAFGSLEDFCSALR
jgi:peptidoglycan/xylan/chitin deacetylase (PgdA/CDA1 family)/cytoskeletal protein RodZ